MTSSERRRDIFPPTRREKHPTPEAGILEAAPKWKSADRLRTQERPELITFHKKNLKMKYDGGLLGRMRYTIDPVAKLVWVHFR